MAKKATNRAQIRQPLGSPRGDAQELRAVHIIAGLAPIHGGPSYSVPRLCEALTGAGADVSLLSVGSENGGEAEVKKRAYWDQRFAQDYAGVPILRDLRRSSGLSHALHQSAVAADIIHDHGLWLMPNIEAGRAARRAGKPLLVSPRGMLASAALAFSRRKKRLFWNLLQGPAIRHATCLHATSEEEFIEIRGIGLSLPVAVIPNGIDLPELVAEGISKSNTERIALSLGRIHPKKGLDRLIRAWAEIERRFPDWRLRLVGPAEAGHDEELRALTIFLGLSRVSIEGPVYGDAKQTAYRDADLFILPTLNENFGLTVAEALAAGTPVISTKGAPWRGLEVEGCGWWVDHGVEALVAGLANAMVVPRNSLKAMGVRGRAWVARDFSWDRVAREMLDVYRWLARGTEAPSTIRFV